MAGEAIIGVPFKLPSGLRSLIEDPADVPESAGDEVSRRLFKIRSADAAGRRSSAQILITRFYDDGARPGKPRHRPPLPARITLLASERNIAIGAITIGFDAGTGLRVDEPFAAETRVLREAGLRACEFTRMAMDSASRHRHVLASLFHVAHIYAHRMMGFDALLIAVNPRHAAYFEAMLGFQVLGRERLNRRIDAPVVLMFLDLAFAQEQIERFGGMPELATLRRSLYPHFFSMAEEASIVGRLKRTQPDALYSHARGWPPGTLDAPPI